MMIFVLGGSVSFLFAQENCRVQREVPLKLMSAELKRGQKVWKKLNPPIYYLAYTYEDKTTQGIEVSQDGLNRHQNRATTLAVRARAGSPKMDNTRLLKGEDNQNRTFVQVVRGVDPFSADDTAFRMALWRTTQQMAEAAQEELGRVETNNRTSSQRQDDSDDFVIPPVSRYCHTQEAVSFDLEKIGSLLRKAAALTRGKPFVQGSYFEFSVQQGHRYFVDSSGTQVKTPFLYARLNYDLFNQLADGSKLKRNKSYEVTEEGQLPPEEKLLADVRRSLDELEALTHAPEAEPITVPTILKNRAMAVLVHEILGHRLEGHRQKMDSFGKTFTDKVGQPITAPFVTVVDDASLRNFKGVPLLGFYEYDDEGVKSRPVTLVENGVLRGFLMSASPIKGFPVSNGHGRGNLDKRPVARMGNTRLIASESVSYDELEKKLLAEIRSQQKPYGYIIDDLSGGFTSETTNAPQSFKLEPKLVYRMYPDGHKEVVRGADIAGTPLVSFGEIMAAANDEAVFNGYCGAESGWIPVSAISPSVLMHSLEIEKTAKSEDKPPLLPAPDSLQTEGETK